MDSRQRGLSPTKMNFKASGEMKRVEWFDTGSHVRLAPDEINSQTTPVPTYKSQGWGEHRLRGRFEIGTNWRMEGMPRVAQVLHLGPHIRNISLRLLHTLNASLVYMGFPTLPTCLPHTTDGEKERKEQKKKHPIPLQIDASICNSVNNVQRWWQERREGLQGRIHNDA